MRNGQKLEAAREEVGALDSCRMANFTAKGQRCPVVVADFQDTATTDRQCVFGTKLGAAKAYVDDDRADWRCVVRSKEHGALEHFVALMVSKTARHTHRLRKLSASFGLAKRAVSDFLGKIGQKDGAWISRLHLKLRL